MASNFWHRAGLFPPIVCRLFARKSHGPPLSTEEIAHRACRSEYWVIGISQLLSWDEVTVGDMRTFLKACDLDFQDQRAMRRVKAYLRAIHQGKIGRTFAYLERSPDYQNVYLPLRIRYEQAICNSR